MDPLRQVFNDDIELTIFKLRLQLEDLQYRIYNHGLDIATANELEAVAFIIQNRIDALTAGKLV